MKALTIALLFLARTADAATLAWTDNSDNEDGFVIQKKVGGKFVKIGQAVANSTMFVVTIAPGAKPCFRVRAFNAQQVSKWSNTVCYQPPQ